MREAVSLAALVGDCKTVLLPGLVEQADHAVVEEIEEIAEGRVLLAEPLQYQLGIGLRENSEGAGQTHEIDFQERGPPFGGPHRLNLAGGKRQGGPRAETRHLRRGFGESSHGPAAGRQLLQQAHGLEEVEPVGLALQQFGDFGAR